MWAIFILCLCLFGKNSFKGHRIIDFRAGNAKYFFVFGGAGNLPYRRRVIKTSVSLERLGVELPPGSAFQAAFVGGIALDERAAQLPVRTAHKPRYQAELAPENLPFSL
jgi:hypothetical protein